LDDGEEAAHRWWCFGFKRQQRELDWVTKGENWQGGALQGGCGSLFIGVGGEVMCREGFNADGRSAPSLLPFLLGRGRDTPVIYFLRGREGARAVLSFRAEEAARHEQARRQLLLPPPHSKEGEGWLVGPKRPGCPRVFCENKKGNRMVWFVGWAECKIDQ
jgi:hypothetical protein